ncbi:hypothetical protein DFH06DRAFT_1473211 [Mycena polygramma]|nr:hypothetical protein DFH06DRAFT_1473211 [Mycena polygramma]
MEPATDAAPEPEMQRDKATDEMHKQREEDETHKERPLALDAEQEQTVHALARSMSQTSDTATRGSVRSHATHVDHDNEKHADGKNEGTEPANPFAGEAKFVHMSDADKNLCILATFRLLKK